MCGIFMTNPNPYLLIICEIMLALDAIKVAWKVSLRVFWGGIYICALAFSLIPGSCLDKITAESKRDQCPFF